MGSAFALLALVLPGFAGAQDSPPAWRNPVVTHRVSDVSTLVKSLLDRQEPRGSLLYIAKQTIAQRMPPEMRSRLPGPSDRFDLSEGEYAGNWQLLNPRQQFYPTVAIRTQVRESLPYRVDVEVFCQKADCGVADTFVANLPAPVPMPTADAALSKSLHDEWVEIVKAEACEPGTAHTEAPPFPQEELRAGFSGTVTLGLFANRCGEVRESWVVTSSGNPNVDKSAVETAKRWRINVPPDGKAGWLKVPISFSPDDLPSPATSSTSKQKQ